MALQNRVQLHRHSSSLTRDRLLLALWALSLNRFGVLYADSTKQTIRRLQRRLLLLLLDTLEHTLVEPCMSTLFNQKASEGLWIC